MTLGLICCLQAALSKASGALQILSSLQQGQVRGQDSWPAHELSWSCFLDGCQGLRSREVLVKVVASRATEETAGSMGEETQLLPFVGRLMVKYSINTPTYGAGESCLTNAAKSHSITH